MASSTAPASRPTAPNSSAPAAVPANAYLLACHTCRHSIGMESGDGLWCTKLSICPPGMQCRHFEREAGADLPEFDSAVAYQPPVASRPAIYMVRVPATRAEGVDLSFPL